MKSLHTLREITAPNGYQIAEYVQFTDTEYDTVEEVATKGLKDNLEFELNGQTVTGIAYTMNSGSISPPSIGYYECIRKGYLANGMDTKYLDEALVNSYQPNTDVSIEQEETEDQKDGLSEEDGWSFWGTM